MTHLVRHLGARPPPSACRAAVPPLASVRPRRAGQLGSRCHDPSVSDRTQEGRGRPAVLDSPGTREGRTAARRQTSRPPHRRNQDRGSAARACASGTAGGRWRGTPTPQRKQQRSAIASSGGSAGMGHRPEVCRARGHPPGSDAGRREPGGHGRREPRRTARRPAHEARAARPHPAAGRRAPRAVALNQRPTSPNSRSSRCGACAGHRPVRFGGAAGRPRGQHQRGANQQTRA
jgi:hypothetical protein